MSDALVTATAGSGRKVALTFDDGPSTEWTPQVLALLDQYGAKATFCVVGQQARAYPAVLRKVVAKGHRLCDHSENHDERIARLPEAELRIQIGGARDAVLAALPGVEIPWFRAPGGSWSRLIRTTAASYGMKPLGWSVDSRDWERGGVDKIIANVKRELRPGGVILMHDGGGDRRQSVAALRKLLPWLIAQGYSFDFPD
ncbi:MAG: polysaccharide deacetylase family protein [Streptomycetaceae bacterium]|nr:polysaccharide deacetylase family protein [Streptomycetaceae bacterium]